MDKLTVGFALCGSFCTFKEVIENMKELTNKGYNIIPIMSFNAFNTDTRFGKAKDLIEEVEDICKDKIIDGFSIVLNDGKNYCFRLTIEDQLNLMSIENQLNSGVETFVYHATNQPCRCFSKIDMAKILATFKQHI